MFWEQRRFSLSPIKEDKKVSEKRFIEQYTVSAWHMSGIILSTGDTLVNKKKREKEANKQK